MPKVLGDGASIAGLGGVVLLHGGTETQERTAGEHRPGGPGAAPGGPPADGPGLHPERFTFAGLPPVTNHSYAPRRRKGKGFYKVGTAVAWQEGAFWEAKGQRLAQNWRGVLASIVIVLHMKRPLGSDWDGRPKAVQDAIAQALGFDDRYVVAGTVIKRRLLKGQQERTEVTLEPWEGGL